MTDIEADLSELGELVADVGKIPGKLFEDVRKAGEKGAVNIKNDWRKSWGGSRYAPALAQSVTYTRSFGPGAIEYEIGPDKNKRQGALGNIYEFGTKNNPPQPGGIPAAEKEEPRLYSALEKVLGGAFD